MSISSLFANLLIPLNLCVALLVAAVVLFMLRWRKSAYFLVGLSLCWGVFWSLPASSLWAGGRLEQFHPYTAPQDLPAAQAIVVLGGHTAGGRNNWFEPYDKETAISRTDTAAQLYKAHRAPLIVLSGAALEGKVSEAESMANSLHREGIPQSAILLEAESDNTHQNAAFTAKLLKERNIQRILVVTSALHMPRAMAAFEKQGLTPIAAPSPAQIVVPKQPTLSFWLPDQRAFDASRSIIKEYVGLVVYWLRGWI